ncbi:MAG: hypothetical protein H6702_17945 [Myxococcales bacterium]|nr:hypothetical protein [Myxococcales bacterium]
MSPGRGSARRAAALRAVLPTPAGHPARALDDPSFWASFDAHAPAHLRLATSLGAGLLAGVLPWLLRADLAKPDGRTRVLAATARLPGGAALLEVLKVVAAFAAFDDPAVQAHLREGPP